LLWADSQYSYLTNAGNSYKLYPLRWGVAARDFTGEAAVNTKKLFRLLAIKSKTIAFNAVVFFYTMTKRPYFQIFWMALVLLLCLGSSLILPLLNLIGLDGAEIFDMDVDDYLAPGIGAPQAHSISVKIRPAYLILDSVSFAPFSPPPEDH
jgi:hypothetical protein